MFCFLLALVMQVKPFWPHLEKYTLTSPSVNPKQVSRKMTVCSGPIWTYNKDT